jgi:acetyltransferase-like isoleucine patch superfamily enzyme
MRKIRLPEILTFAFLFSLVLGLAVATSYVLLASLPLGDFRALALVVGAVVASYAYALMAYRLFMRLVPLPVGEIAERSREEYGYHVYLLFYLILFYPVMRSGAMPVPLMRLFYLALGARLGDNTYSSGIILDPPMIRIGANSIVGQYALLVPHVIEGRKLAHYPIEIGDNVTVGAHAVVLSDVTIGNDAIVATGAIVSKGTRIGAGEVWGGVPARRIK